MSATNWKDWVVDVAKAMWVYSAAGDIAYALSANQKARLAIGASQSLLMSNGSAPTWLAKGTVESILKVNSSGALAWLAKGAAESILRVDSTGALAWLNKGAANQVLGVNAAGTALEWKTPAKAVKGTRVVCGSFSLANVTLTQVAFSAETYDELNSWTSGSSTRVTIPEEGWYMVGAYVSYDNNSNGRRLTNIIVNGTTEVVATDMRNAVSGGVTNVSLCNPYYFYAGQYIELQVYQTSGGALAVTSSVLYLVQL